MASTRQAGLRRTRAVVALCRGRLLALRGVRFARVVAALCAAGFAAAAVMLRVTDGADASLEGLTVTAAHWIAWIAGAPLAFAAAEDHAARDRRDGVEALAAMRGISPAALDSGRTIGAMTAVAWAIGAPLAALALFTAALAGRGSVALHRAGLGLSALAFAVIAGVTLGGVGSVCSRVGRARGRWLLAAVLLGPWVLADLTGQGAWSIPGALGAVLDFLLGARSSHA
jgi:hypothetical protein